MSDTVKCTYCGATQPKAILCAACGGPLQAEQARPEDTVQRWGPMFYNGYIVYEIDDRCRRSLSVQFWLGRELIETIEISRDVWEHFTHDTPNVDHMSLFWDLFEVSQGHQETAEIALHNIEFSRPVQFELHVVRTPGQERLRGLAYRDFVDAYRADKSVAVLQ